MAHHSDLLDEMKKFSGDLPNHKQIEVLKKLAEETKAHLRRFVAMRGN